MRNKIAVAVLIIVIAVLIGYWALGSAAQETPAERARRLTRGEFPGNNTARQTHEAPTRGQPVAHPQPARIDESVQPDLTDEPSNAAKRTTQDSRPQRSRTSSRRPDPGPQQEPDAPRERRGSRIAKPQ